MSIISNMENHHVCEAAALTEHDKYVEAPLVKTQTVDYRAYQVDLAEIASRQSTIIVLSTGLGKTVIAALLAAKRLMEYQGSKVLFLAPSRPPAGGRVDELCQV